MEAQYRLQWTFDWCTWNIVLLLFFWMNKFCYHSLELLTKLRTLLAPYSALKRIVWFQVFNSLNFKACMPSHFVLIIGRTMCSPCNTYKHTHTWAETYVIKSYTKHFCCRSSFPVKNPTIFIKSSFPSWPTIQATSSVIIFPCMP